MFRSSHNIREFVNGFSFVVTFTLISVLLGWGMTSIFVSCNETVSVSETQQDTIYVPTVFQDTVTADNRIVTIVKVRDKEFIIFKFGKSITACPY